jgi:hypothetical protein
MRDREVESSLRVLERDIKRGKKTYWRANRIALRMAHRKIKEYDAEILKSDIEKRIKRL